jgi:UDP-galactopyranose mutase
MKKKAIIVGGGFTGCTMAYFLTKKGYNVTIYEGSDVLGGGCRTFFYRGHPYTFGPRHLILKTGDDEALEFFQSFFKLRRIEHYVLTYPNGGDRFYNYPPLISDIDLMPQRDKIFDEIKNRDLNSNVENLEDYWKNSIGETLYNMFIEQYSKKMWGIKNNQELDEDISFSLKKEPIRNELKDYFEGEKIVLYPENIDGYNSYFEKTTKNCNVVFNTFIEKFDINRKAVYANNKWDEADILVSTTSPDKLLNYKYGELRYKGRDFLKIILPIERITPEPYYFLYYAGDEPYTRIVEYKLLTGYKSNDTLIGIEFPSDKNKLYPYPTKADVQRAKRYLSSLPEGVLSMGRLGSYKYKDMYEIYNDCKDVVKRFD